MANLRIHLVRRSHGLEHFLIKELAVVLEQPGERDAQGALSDRQPGGQGAGVVSPQAAARLQNGLQILEEYRLPLARVAFAEAMQNANQHLMTPFSVVEGFRSVVLGELLLLVTLLGIDSVRKAVGV